MTLLVHRVVLPWGRQDGDPSQPTAQVAAAASSPAAAVATAAVLVEGLAVLEGRPAAPQIERARSWSTGEEVEGPYLYAFAASRQVSCFPLPRRLNAAAARQVTEILDGLIEGRARAVVLDGAVLAGLDARGVYALVARHREMPIHVFRLNEAARRVLDGFGILTVLGVHPNLRAAVGALGRRRQLPPPTGHTMRLVKPVREAP